MSDWHPTKARRQARTEARAAGCTCHPTILSTPDRRVIVTHDDDCPILRAGPITVELGDLEQYGTQMDGAGKTIRLPAGTPNLVHAQVREAYPNATVLTEPAP